MLQKGTEQAHTAIGARLTIMFFVPFTSNVKFIRYPLSKNASPTAKLRGARPTAKLRGLSKTPQNAKFEHFEHFIFGQNYAMSETNM